MGRPIARREVSTPIVESMRARYAAVASPSTFGLVARMTSVTVPSARRLMSEAMFSWSGPTPWIGSMTPPRTW